MSQSLMVHQLKRLSTITLKVIVELINNRLTDNTNDSFNSYNFQV